MTPFTAKETEGSPENWRLLGSWLVYELATLGQS
jgi:hypothetical protein